MKIINKFKGVCIQISIKQLDQINSLSSSTIGTYCTYVDLNDYIDFEDCNPIIESLIKKDISVVTFFV